MLHKSLSDFLRDPALCGDHVVNESTGHSFLGLQLIKDISQASDSHGDLIGLTTSEYALKYGVFHLCAALRGGKLDL